MDLKKIFNLVLSDFVKNKEPRNIRLGRFEDNVCVIDRGYRMFLIDEKNFPFKIDICGPLVRMDNLVPDVSTYDFAEYTGDQKQLSDGKMVAIIRNETTEVWVDTDLLKLFGKDLKLKISTKNPQISPVFVYGGETWLGLVLPVRQRRGV